MLRLASFKRDRWKLDSAVKRHKESPDTFQIPTRTARATLRLGDAAKLLFCFTQGVERMWVITVGRRENLYEGVLINEPVSFDTEVPPVQKGSTVAFKAEHIANIDVAPLEFLRKTYGKKFARRCEMAREVDQKA